MTAPTTDPVARVLAKLGPIRRNGAGWIARCPAHDDKVPSLKVDTGDDGRALVHCHAGCATGDVAAAIGLPLSDLFADDATTPTRETIYPYRDEAGTLLYEVVRTDPGKRYAQRRADGEWTMTGVRRVLYRLPELIAADPAATVYVVEGEKDADRLAALGLIATTASGGAGKWRPEYAEPLHGRRVVILPDNDDPGREHARAVAASTGGTIVELPGLPPKGDVSDWLDAGGTLDELRRLSATSPRSDVAPSLDAFLTMTTDRPMLIPEVIASAGLVVFAGEPRSFKTMAAMQLGFAIGSGLGWLGRLPAETGGTLYVSEEGSAPRIVERLKALREAYDPHEDFRILHRAGTRLTDPVSWGRVLRTLDDMGRPRLVILDTLAALSDGDENSAEDVRDALRPMHALIGAYGVTVLLVHHTNKTGEGRFGKRMRGSSVLWGACDAVLGFVRDERNGQPAPSGTVQIETKDGDPARVRFDFDADRLLLDADARPHLTVDGLVTELTRRGMASLGEMRAYFDSGRSRLNEIVREAEGRGLIVRETQGRETYLKLRPR